MKQHTSPFFTEHLSYLLRNGKLADAYSVLQLGIHLISVVSCSGEGLDLRSRGFAWYSIRGFERPPLSKTVMSELSFQSAVLGPHLG